MWSAFSFLQTSAFEKNEFRKCAALRAHEHVTKDRLSRKRRARKSIRIYVLDRFLFSNQESMEKEYIERFVCF